MTMLKIVFSSQHWKLQRLSAMSCRIAAVYTPALFAQLKLITLSFLLDMALIPTTVITGRFATLGVSYNFGLAIMFTK
jgi:hypothetical protein